MAQNEEKTIHEKSIVYVAKFYPGSAAPNVPPKTRNIFIHTRSGSDGGDLSPYVLRNEHGHLLENIWQFSKVYETVCKLRTPLHKMQPNVIVWEHPAERHVDENGDILPAYWAWRKKGLRNSRAVRYPNGYDGRKSCKFILWPARVGDEVFTHDPDGVPMTKLGYVEARKRVYCGEYIRLANGHPTIERLQALRRMGIHLQIVEVDGPAVGIYNHIANGKEMTTQTPGLRMNRENIRYLLHDQTHPFGHGFTIAAILLYWDTWID